jgi:hypothetical protein
MMKENRITEVMDRVALMVEPFVKEMRERLKEEQFGHHEPDDEQFRLWFEMMAQASPNWAAALPLVEGGMDVIKRYEKVAGYRSD